MWIIEYNKEFLALMGSFTALVSIFYQFYSKYTDRELKEKELSLKITSKKQKELFSKKIYIYEKLFDLYIQFDNDDSEIGKYKDKNFYDEGKKIHKEEVKIEEYEVKMKVVRKILRTIHENIFYISEITVKEYQALYKSFKSSFEEYEYNCKIGVYSDPSEKYEEQLNYEKEQAELKAEKDFYSKNTEGINRLLQYIKNDFKNLKKSVEF